MGNAQLTATPSLLPASGYIITNFLAGYSASTTFSAFGTSSTYTIGAFSTQFTPTASVTTVNTALPYFVTYCIEENVNLPDNQFFTTKNTTLNLSANWGSSNTGKALAFLYQKYGASNSTNTNAVFQASGATRGRRGAAIQLALWEVAHDFDGTIASLNLGVGNIQTNASTNATTSAAATLYINDLKTAVTDGSINSYTSYWFSAPNTPTSGQDLIGPSWQGLMPEPTPLYFVLVGAVGLFLFRRKA